MVSRRASPPDGLRIALAHALGYPDYPSSVTAEPYLNYIANRHIGRGTLEEYLKLFIRVIEHFSQVKTKPNDSPKRNSIRALIDGLVLSENEDLFADTKASSTMRKEDVEDTVMYIMGAWAMMLSSFVQLPNSVRKVTMAYNIREQAEEKKSEAYNESLTGLLRGSGLLPRPGNAQVSQDADAGDEIVRAAVKLVALLSGANGALFNSNSSIKSPLTPSFGGGINSNTYISDHCLDAMDSLESLSIRATRLNAFTLNVLGAVQLSWTHNISRHMLLSRHGGRHILEIFALPCTFNATTLTSDAVGLSSELLQEVQESYCILFNAWPDSSMHVRLGRLFSIRKFCWCWSCSAYRFRTSTVAQYKKSFRSKSRNSNRSRNGDQRNEYDPLLVELMNNSECSDCWTQDLFPCLWSRIMLLEEHQISAKPWSIWILFRDRRDTLQFWTFFFATIVVLLTFLQVILGAAQVAGSFL